MNKKLLAVAVAGVFAAPAAFAQSSVTISGTMKGGYESMKYSNVPAPGYANSGQNGVVDDSSRLLFNVKEDLGGGLSAIVQLDMRLKPDDQGATPAAITGAITPGNVISGNSFYGLSSTQWGTISFGRRDLHYFNTEGNMPDKASLRTSQVSLLAYAGGGGTAIANATRTQNVVHYLSPNWSGFTFILAYSSNPTSVDSDINSNVRKGYAWNFNPNYQAANWQVGYSYWDSKPDATTNNNQRGDRLYGSYVFPFGLKLGLAYDKSRIKTTTGLTTSKRDVWSLPVHYTWGNHGIYFHYDWAGNDKATAVDDKATMWALAYAYDLSKRTSVAVSYAQINNHVGAFYNFFTATSLGIGGPGIGAAQAGADPRMFGVTLRHAF